MLEKTFIETNEQFKSGCGLNKYNGEYNICSANRGKDEKIYMKWVFPSTRDKRPSSKTIPLQINLGDRENAIRILEMFVKILKDESEEPMSQEPSFEPDGLGKQDNDNDDPIPF